MTKLIENKNSEYPARQFNITSRNTCLFPRKFNGDKFNELPQNTTLPPPYVTYIWQHLKGSRTFFCEQLISRLYCFRGEDKNNNVYWIFYTLIRNDFNLISISAVFLCIVLFDHHGNSSNKDASFYRERTTLIVADEHCEARSIGSNNYSDVTAISSSVKDHFQYFLVLKHVLGSWERESNVSITGLLLFICKTTCLSTNNVL